MVVRARSQQHSVFRLCAMHVWSPHHAAIVRIRLSPSFSQLMRNSLICLHAYAAVSSSDLPLVPRASPSAEHTASAVPEHATRIARCTSSWTLVRPLPAPLGGPVPQGVAPGMTMSPPSHTCSACIRCTTMRMEVGPCSFAALCAVSAGPIVRLGVSLVHLSRSFCMFHPQGENPTHKDNKLRTPITLSLIHISEPTRPY